MISTSKIQKKPKSTFLFQYFYKKLNKLIQKNHQKYPKLNINAKNLKKILVSLIILVKKASSTPYYIQTQPALS